MRCNTQRCYAFGRFSEKFKMEKELKVVHIREYVIIIILFAIIYSSLNLISANELCDPSNSNNLPIEINSVYVLGFGEDYYWYPTDELSFDIYLLDENASLSNVLVDYCFYDIETDKCMIKKIEGPLALNSENSEFEFNYKLDPELLDLSNKNYYLFVKAYINNTEQSICYKADVQLNKDDNFVILDYINFPEYVMKGNEYALKGEVWNIGFNDQKSVSIRVVQEDFGINEMVYIGDIESFKMKEFTFNITIPEEINRDNHYPIQMTVLNSNNEVFESYFENSGPLRTIYYEDFYAKDYVPPSIISINQITEITEEDLLLEVNVTNIGRGPIIYNLEVSEWEDWASTSHFNNDKLSISPDETKSTILNFSVKNNLDGEKHFLISIYSNDEHINVYSDDVLIEQKDVSIFIKKKDSDSPTIVILNPDSNMVIESNDYSKNIDFSFKVTNDSEIEKCELVIDGVIKQTKTNIQNDTQQSFIEDLNRGNYKWQIKCIDSYNNQILTNENNIEIKKNKSSHSSRNNLDKLNNLNNDLEVIYYNQGIKDIEKDINYPEEENADLISSKGNVQTTKKDNFNIILLIPIFLLTAILICFIIILNVRRNHN